MNQDKPLILSNLQRNLVRMEVYTKFLRLPAGARGEKAFSDICQVIYNRLRPSCNVQN